MNQAEHGNVRLHEKARIGIRLHLNNNLTSQRTWKHGLIYSGTVNTALYTIVPQWANILHCFAWACHIIGEHYQSLVKQS